MSLSIEQACQAGGCAQLKRLRVLLAREEMEAVWTAVASLSQQQRAIFLLRFAEEMSLPEIAGVLSLSVGTVKAHLFRATAKIRETVRDKSCS